MCPGPSNNNNNNNSDDYDDNDIGHKIVQAINSYAVSVMSNSTGIIQAFSWCADQKAVNVMQSLLLKGYVDRLYIPNVLLV